MAIHNVYSTPFPNPIQAAKRLGQRPVKRPVERLARRIGGGLIACSLSLGLALSTALPTLAADPFRNTSTHGIGEHTEAAFKAIFKDGDYVRAEAALAEAAQSEADEPLVHAMLASLAYIESNWDEVEARAQQTKATATALKSSDPLRGHLYSAVGTFLEGAHILKTQGIARGTPMALGMLQQVFSELDQAEAIDATDPELNLLKGYMDLMLAVNLPFANPEEAIERMDQYGSPVYLSQRGIAIGYRDLDQPDEAIVAVDKALSAAPENPELYYLKAQLLARQGAQANSAALFRKALEYSEQLPPALVQRITWEGCVAEGLLNDQQCLAEAGYQ